MAEAATVLPSEQDLFVPPKAEIVQKDRGIQPQLVAWSTKYDTTPEEILRFNNITDTGEIKPLQVLEMPGQEGGVVPGEEPLMKSLLNLDPGLGEGSFESGVFKDQTTGEEFSLDQSPLTGESPETTAAIGTEEGPSLTGATVGDILPPSDKLAGEEGWKPEGTFDLGAEEIYVVKQGDTLSKISKNLGVPLRDLASYNNILNVDAIDVGQEIKYLKPGGGEQLFIGPEGTEEGVLGKQPVVTETTSDEGTRTDIDTGPDLEAEPVEETVIAKAEEIPDEEPGFVSDPKEETKTAIENVKTGITNQDTKNVYQQVTQKLSDLGITEPDEKYWESLVKPINAEIRTYDQKIQTIAEEKYKPKFEGTNKWLAVLGAALGAYGSAMTGTPNFALNILENSIERDKELFLASKEIRTRSLERQRLDVITRRGELLQFAQNEASRMLQVAGLKIQAELGKANMQKIQDELEMKKKKNKDDYNLAVSQMGLDAAISSNTLKASLNKENQKKFVPSVTLTDENGNPVILPAWTALSEEEAKKQRGDIKTAIRISEVMDKMDAEYARGISAFAPALFSDTATAIRGYASELNVLMKEMYGMGANYTQYEQALITQQIPTDEWMQKFSMYKRKSQLLRQQVIGKQRAAMKAYGSGSVQASTKKQKKKIPGLKTTGIKVNVETSK